MKFRLVSLHLHQFFCPWTFGLAATINVTSYNHSAGAQ